MAKILKRIGEYINNHAYITLIGGCLAIGTLLDLGGSYWTYSMDIKPFEELQKLPLEIEVLKCDLRRTNAHEIDRDLDLFYQSFNIARMKGSVSYRDIKKLTEPLDKFLSESTSIVVDKDYKTSLYDPKFRKQLEEVLDQTKINCENYDGDLDGKFHYYPFGIAIFGFAGLIASSVTYFHMKYLDKRDKEKNKKDSG